MSMCLEMIQSSPMLWSPPVHALPAPKEPFMPRLLTPARACQAIKAIGCGAGVQAGRRRVHPPRRLAGRVLVSVPLLHHHCPPEPALPPRDRRQGAPPHQALSPPVRSDPHITSPSCPSCGCTVHITHPLTGSGASLLQSSHGSERTSIVDIEPSLSLLCCWCTGCGLPANVVILKTGGMRLRRFCR